MEAIGNFFKRISPFKGAAPEEEPAPAKKSAKKPAKKPAAKPAKAPSKASGTRKSKRSVAKSSIPVAQRGSAMMADEYGESL